MAKSLHRKMHAEKPKKNAPREINRLKFILKVDSDVLMKDVCETATVVIPKQCQVKTQYVAYDEKDVMKTQTEIRRNKKTLLDQHGQYPMWMNQRQRKRLGTKKDKKTKQNKARAIRKLKEIKIFFPNTFSLPPMEILATGTQLLCFEEPKPVGEIHDENPPREAVAGRPDNTLADADDLHSGIGSLSCHRLGTICGQVFIKPHCDYHCSAA
ncbi:protein LLP homolog [Acomys russatus]|uniref:protein LLP homolog n=1 Tax=Acomys russatus TaxID=60746 RepID=UPI0021E2623B|nr:protein LLP homolog [Acomys russatus]